ncbi:hypothetical protein [Streptomyces sp. NPDC017993]|uniref:hypothetical protein n=1 Tax=Streptomyces sp. NPDC017993 TaxID=3365027 RepID=UPI0037A03206
MDSHFTAGGLDVPALAPMTATNAEGPMPDGSRGQVFGGLRAGEADAAAIPAPFDGLRVRPQYAGFSDFYSDGVHRGAIDMTFRLTHPLLGKHCTLGADSDPVKFRLIQDGATEWVSKEPPIVRFAVHDTTFAAPRAHNCGPLGRLLDKRLHLPAASGENGIRATASYTFRSYDRLPERQATEGGRPPGYAAG